MSDPETQSTEKMKETMYNLYCYYFNVKPDTIYGLHSIPTYQELLFYICREQFFNLSKKFKIDNVNYEHFCAIVNVDTLIQTVTIQQSKDDIKNICNKYTSNKAVSDYKQRLVDVYLLYSVEYAIDIIAKYFVYAYHLLHDEKIHYNRVYVFAIYRILYLLSTPNCKITDMSKLFEEIIRASKDLKIDVSGEYTFFVPLVLTDLRYDTLKKHRLLFCIKPISSTDEALIKIARDYEYVLDGEKDFKKDSSGPTLESIKIEPILFDRDNYLFSVMHDPSINIAKFRSYMYVFHSVFKTANCYLKTDDTIADDSNKYDINPYITNDIIYDALIRIDNALDMKDTLTDNWKEAITGNYSELYAQRLSILPELRDHQYLLSSTIDANTAKRYHMGESAINYFNDYEMKIDYSSTKDTNVCTLEYDVFDNIQLTQIVYSWLLNNSIYWTQISSPWYSRMTIYVSVYIDPSDSEIKLYKNHLILQYIHDGKYSIRAGIQLLLNDYKTSPSSTTVTAAPIRDVSGLYQYIYQLLQPLDPLKMNIEQLKYIVKYYDENEEIFKSFMYQFVSDYIYDVIHILTCARLLDIEYLFGFLCDFVSYEVRETIYHVCKKDDILKSIDMYFSKPNMYHSKYVRLLKGYKNDTNIQQVKTVWKQAKILEILKTIFSISEGTYRISDFLERISTISLVDISNLNNEFNKLNPYLSNDDSKVQSSDLYLKYGVKYLRFLWYAFDS